MTLLVKNVRLVGASAEFPSLADVFVQGDMISAIGSFPNKKADEVIDGQGIYLAPGFVDVHALADHSFGLFRRPDATAYLSEGITSIVCGQGGVSLAPIVTGSLELFEKWGVPRGFNINWRSMAEFVKSLRRRTWGVNIATLVGYETVRREIAPGTTRALTKNELKVIEGLLGRSLKEGAIGISLGLDGAAAYAMGTPEKKSLFRVAGKYGTVCSVEPKQDEREHETLLKEVASFASAARVPAIIPHLLPLREKPERFRKVLEGLTALPKTAQVYFGIHPFSAAVLPLSHFLPLWVREADRREMLSALKDPWRRSRIVADLPDIDPKEFIVLDAGAHRSLRGKSLFHIMVHYGRVDPREALVRFMESTGLQATVMYGNVNRTLLGEALSHPSSLLISQAGFDEDASGARSLLRGQERGAFPAYLDLAEKENLLPLDAAIQKITALPAKLFHLEKRGILKEGYFADLTGFKDGKIIFVVVNGKIAFRDGKCVNGTAGQILANRHTHGVHSR